MICLLTSYLFIELTIHTLNFSLPLQDSGLQLTEQYIKLLNCRFQENFPSFYFLFVPEYYEI